MSDFQWWHTECFLDLAVSRCLAGVEILGEKLTDTNPCFVDMCWVPADKKHPSSSVSSFAWPVGPAWQTLCAAWRLMERELGRGLRLGLLAAAHSETELGANLILDLDFWVAHSLYPVSSCES